MSLSDQDRERLLEKFRALDANNDGKLSKSEVKSCIDNSNLPASKLEEFMGYFDLSGDGVITLEEYSIALGLSPPIKTSVSSLRRAFDDLDKDHSGYLTYNELLQMFVKINIKNITDGELRQGMKRMDGDGNGRVSFDELRVYLQSKGCAE